MRRGFELTLALALLVGLAQASAEMESCFEELNSKVASMEVPANLAAFQAVVSMDKFSSRRELEGALQEATRRPELRALTKTMDATCNKQFGPAFEGLKLSTGCGKDIDEFMALYSDNGDKRARFLPKFPKVAQLNEAFEFCASVRSVHGFLDFDPETDLRKEIPLFKDSGISY